MMAMTLCGPGEAEVAALKARSTVLEQETGQGRWRNMLISDVWS